jgi:hypothetical protein
MAWTDSLTSVIAGSKTVVSPEGRPYVSTEIAPKEYVEVHLTTGVNELPFKIFFKRFDAIGGILEEREYAHAGTLDLARKLAIETANLRLNAFEFILDGEKAEIQLAL